LESDYYIREDYLSSGEYFIINIYKLIQKRCKLIAIDEIDISLDAMAQVRFVEKLRDLSEEYGIKLLFSTHSLALIKTLKDDELYYMELHDGVCSFENRSYNYIKSLLYGFQDYDKYILTEDKLLKEYIEFILKDMSIFPKYIILPIGTHDSTIRLMETNKDKKVFEDECNVCSVLDGDAKEQYPNNSNIYFLPFLSIEKELHKDFIGGQEFIGFSENELKKLNLNSNTTAKVLYKRLIENQIKIQHEIFEFISGKKSEEVEEFKSELLSFLNSSQE
jgi:energy-coupling factor transporter ATP-binding protein EcfA2